MLEQTKKMYADIGVDVEKALDTLSNIPISIHCWQGDDVMGSIPTAASPGASKPPATIPARPVIPRSSWRIWSWPFP